MTENTASKPGNENIDPEKLIGQTFDLDPFHYTEREVSLYALGIGMARDPLDLAELPFVYELSNMGHKVFPTFAVIFPFGTLLKLIEMDGIEFHPMMLLHGEQRLEVPGPLPAEATVSTHGRVTHVYDKIKGAVVVTESVSKDESGNVLATNTSKMFIRGLGNFGGDRGPTEKVNIAPAREPDAIEEQATEPNQALLYRLSGDRNPLHADPAMAAMGRFDRPILHGLCTFGMAARAALKHFADYDPARFASIEVRFARHVFPGETIITEMWRESEDRIVFQCKAKERNALVITNAAVTLR